MTPTDLPRLLTPAEAAALLCVSKRTLIRWGDSGHLAVVRTPGGHRRYYEQEIISRARNGFDVDNKSTETGDTS